MWTCPKCGRAFQRQNQGHYCGKAPETIAEYIASQSPEAQPHLNVLHSLIREILPEAKAEIKWSMPTYRSGAFSLSFAACKKQVSLYADSDILAFFAPQLQEFVIRKKRHLFTLQQGIAHRYHRANSCPIFEKTRG